MKKIWFLIFFAFLITACRQTEMSFVPEVQHFGKEKAEFQNDFKMLDRIIITWPIHYKECVAKNGSGNIHSENYWDFFVHSCTDPQFSGSIWDFNEKRDDYDSLEYDPNNNKYSLNPNKDEVITKILENVKLPIVQQNSLIELMNLTGEQIQYKNPKITSKNSDLIKDSFLNSGPKFSFSGPFANNFQIKRKNNWLWIQKTSERKDEPQLTLRFEEGREIQVGDLRFPDRMVKQEGYYPYDNSPLNEINEYLRSQVSSKKTFSLLTKGEEHFDEEKDERKQKEELYLTGEISHLKYDHLGFKSDLCFQSYCFDPEKPIQNYKDRYYQHFEYPERELFIDLFYNENLQLFIRSGGDFGESKLSWQITNKDYALQASSTSFCSPTLLNQKILKGKENLTFPQHLTFFGEKYSLQDLDFSEAYTLNARNQYGYVDYIDELFDSPQEAETIISEKIKKELKIFNTYIFRFASYPNISLVYSNTHFPSNPEAIIFSKTDFNLNQSWDIITPQETRSVYCDLWLGAREKGQCPVSSPQESRTHGAMLFLDEEREKKAHWMQGENERDKVLIFDQAILPLFKLQKSTIQDYYFVFGAEGVDFDSGGYGCKPVVYTYDQHERPNSLEITLPPQSRFTKLIPHFSTGTRWDFHADKNSQITFENQTFPYLYYSTFRKNYQNNNYGRTVKGRDIPLFLENKLTYMNLNQKEKADFLEYRLPEFKADLVYSVSFKFNEQFEPYARLSWKHKPEKIFRMFMEAHEHPQGHYTSFDPRYPDAGNERFLERFERGSSFDVLEW